MGTRPRLIERIRLKHVDSKNPYGYPTRTVEIRTKRGILLTPTRAVTNHEYRQKEIVPSDIALDDKISLHVSRFGKSPLEKFLKEDAPFDSMVRRLEIQQMRSHALLDIVLAKPVSESHKLLEQKTIREKFYRMSIQAQKIAGYDTISASIPKIPVTDAKQMINDLDKIATKEDLSCVFFFEPGKDFPELLDYTINNTQQRLIGFHYKRFDKAVQSYEAMRKYSDKDVAFLVANITRSDNRFENLSTIHYMPFLSSDVFTSFAPSPMPVSNTENRHDKLSKLLLFDKRRLTLNKMIDKDLDAGQVLEEIDRPGDEMLREMLDNFREATKYDSDLKIQRLSAFSKVHESKASSFELAEFAKWIKESGTKEYVDEEDKNVLKSAVSVLPK